METLGVILWFDSLCKLHHFQLETNFLSPNPIKRQIRKVTIKKPSNISNTLNTHQIHKKIIKIQKSNFKLNHPFRYFKENYGYKAPIFRHIIGTQWKV